MFATLIEDTTNVTLDRSSFVKPCVGEECLARRMDGKIIAFNMSHLGDPLCSLLFLNKNSG